MTARERWQDVEGDRWTSKSPRGGQAAFALDIGRPTTSSWANPCSSVSNHFLISVISVTRASPPRRRSGR